MNDNMTMTQKINLRNVQTGKEYLDKIKEQTKDPMKYQEEYLLQILQDNKDTEYGRKYDFANIHSIREYQEKVPVGNYDHFAPYIMRESDQCETNLLCSEETSCYNKTSGTVGVPKRIPVNAKSSETLSGYGARYVYALISEKIGLDWTKGRSCNLLECPMDLKMMKNGKYHAAVSSLGILSAKDVLPLIYTSPIEATIPRPDTDTYYLHTLFALKDRELTNIFTGFCSYMLRFFQYIEKNWEILVQDIENGTIDPSIKMCDEVRASVGAKLSADPERAKELRAVFEQGFEEPIVKKLWPNIQYLYGCGTAAFESYYKKIHQRYAGDLIHFLPGYGMSEGICSVPVEANDGNCVFAPQSLFLEFLPMDADENDFSQIKTLDQLEVGKNYEVIVTNKAGFYRYRMRDAVRIMGMYQNTPTMVFLYRVDKTISVMGEKTTEVALRAAAEETEKHFGFDLVGFSVYPDDGYVPPRYIYYMEIANMPEGIKPKEIRAYLDRQLAIANPSMGDKIKKGICAPTRLNFLDDQSYQLYQDIVVYNGGNANQQKPVTIISNEKQRKFFNGMTDYAAEIIK